MQAYSIMQNPVQCTMNVLNHHNPAGFQEIEEYNSLLISLKNYIDSNQTCIELMVVLLNNESQQLLPHKIERYISTLIIDYLRNTQRAVRSSTAK